MGKKKGKSSRTPDSRKYQQLKDDSPKSSSSGARNGKSKSESRKRNEKKNSSGNLTSCDDDGFRKTLQADGSKTIKDMASDGNCLFRSLSDQLYSDYGNKHEQVRNDICDFLQEHEKWFSGFLLLDEDEEDVCAFNEYVSRMRHDGEWGGDVEIVCAARLFRRNISIFSTQGAYQIECGEEKASGRDLLLSYHENSHYNSVIDLNSMKQWNGQKDRQNKNNQEINKESAMNNTHRTETNDKNVPDSSKTVEKGRPQQRNAICSCGSGLKYKKCCLPKEKLMKSQEKFKAKFGLDDEEDEKAEILASELDNTSSSFRLMTI